MSIEMSRDANALLEDIELELASIRAAMALRPLEGSPRPLSAPKSAGVAAVPAIGPFDLSRTGAKSAVQAPVAEGAAAVANTDEQPKRATLQERLASMSDED